MLWRTNKRERWQLLELVCNMKESFLDKVSFKIVLEDGLYFHLWLYHLEPCHGLLFQLFIEASSAISWNGRIIKWCEVRTIFNTCFWPVINQRVRGKGGRNLWACLYAICSCGPLNLGCYTFPHWSPCPFFKLIKLPHSLFIVFIIYNTTLLFIYSLKTYQSTMPSTKSEVS